MGGSQWQFLGPNMLPSISADDLDQLASAVYATDCYLEFRKHDDEYGIASPSSQVPEPNSTIVQMPPNKSSGDGISIDSNLQTILKPYFCSNQLHKSCEIFQKGLSCIESRGNDFLSHDNIRFLAANATLIGTHIQFPSIGQNNPELISSSQQEKSSLRGLEVASFTCSSSSASSGPNVSSKKRMRWNQELHEKFINCVNNLGGAEKATPRTILKMMESKGLTIFQVKSHLQKYRAEKYMSERKQGKTETASSDIPQLCMKNTMQIKETLKLQLNFQKHLNEQLEIQRHVQQKIEENGKQLKMMLQEQQKINKRHIIRQLRDCFQRPAMEGGSKCQKLGPHMLSMSDLDQLASAVYATEKHDGEYGIASHLSSQAPEANTLPPIESSGVEIVTESNLQTILKLLFCSNQHHKSCEMSQKSLFSIESRGNDHFLSHDNIKLLTANPNLIGTHLQFPSIPQNNPELIPPSEREKSSLRDLEVASFTCSSSSAYSRPRHSRKNRMRWSRELHEKFINCVDNLGGAEKATPKTILKMMESKGLTIFHVKSHLQKYRAEKYMSERKQGETERTSSDVPLLYMENIMQIKETLQLQLDFQKQLNEQLEIQRHLQLKIDENGKQLKMMLEEQQKYKWRLLS
eukprot:XP_002530353.2 uncharacterized protein LOC8263213 [Ricinus communis]